MAQPRPTYEGDDFARYVFDEPESPLVVVATPTPSQPATPTSTPRPKRERVVQRPTSTPSPRPPRVVRRQTDRQISGKGSWHDTGRSGYYAAACKKLRVAMGPGWRGEHVIVEYKGRFLGVILNDWCGSHDKLIDLSDEVFRYFAPLSRGVIRVAVGWR